LERLDRATGRVGEPEPCLHLLADQVRDELGVGLRRHGPAAALERGTQLQVVLDDAVVDEDYLASAVRMRVLLRRTPMRRPARVADAGRALERLLAQQPGQAGELAHAAAALYVLVRDGREARRVVAAVLELAESCNQDRARLTRAH